MLSASPGRAALHPNVVLASLLGAGLTFALVQTFVAPALPAIASAYGTDTAHATWVLTASLLSASVATPLVGKLGDTIGRARVLVVVLLVFAVGSAIAGLAGSIELVIVGRVVQGVAGGIFPLSYGILRDTLEPRRVPGAIGLFSAMFGIGGGLGLPLSGVVVEHLGISYLFWTGLLALPAAFAVRRLIMPAPPRERIKVDWLGAVLLSLSLLSLMLGLSQLNAWGLTSARVLALLVGGVGGLTLWVLVERRTREPLVAIDLLRYRPVLMANLSGLMVGASMLSMFLLVPQILQAPLGTGYGFGLSVTAAGLVMLPGALVQLGLAPFAGLLARRVSTRAPLIIGAAAIVVSFGTLVVARDSVAHFLVAFSVLGVGLAFAMSAMANVVVEAVPATQVGVATGINQISRTVGGAFGTQVTAAIVSASMLSGHPDERAYTWAFVVGGVWGLGALAAALAIPRRRGGAAEELETTALAD